MKKFNLLLILFLILIIFPGCTKKDREVVTTKYPTGEKKETTIFKGEKPDLQKIKSFEYYRTGEKKREYSYKDNHFYGPWTYWYKKGNIMATGVINKKTLTPAKGTGSGTYYWPGGEKMIEIAVNKRNELTFTYHDEAGAAYSDDDLPEEIKEKIQSVIARWEKGRI